jgi:hypothetical protein
LSNRVGPNIKTAAMLLLPIPLLLWPPAVIYLYNTRSLIIILQQVLGISLIWAIGVGVFLPTIRTFDGDYNLWYGGIVDVLVSSANYVKKFWNFNSHSYFDYLDQWRSAELKDGEKPFDISVLQILIGVVIGTIGSIVDGIGISIISLAKLLPLIFRGYYEIWKAYTKLGIMWICMFSVIIIVVNIAWPICALLICVVCCICGFFVGLECAWVAYKEGIATAFVKMWIWIVDFDKFSNIIFNSQNSCIDCRHA